jgi:hypothetical protein
MTPGQGNVTLPAKPSSVPRSWYADKWPPSPEFIAKMAKQLFPELCKTDVAEAAIRTLDWLKEARSTGNGKKDSGGTD